MLGVAVVLVVGLIGTVLVFNSRAATTGSSLEVENGTLDSTGLATKVSSSTTSGGMAVKFAGGGTVSGEVKTCYPNAFCKPDGTVMLLNGTNLKGVGSSSASTLCNDWAGMTTHGFNVIRLAVDWPSVETANGTYNWTNLDNTIKMAEDNGQYVILDALHTTTSNGDNIPTWATNGATDIDKLANYGPAYWKAVATRYKGDTHIIAYDLANEPQNGGGTLNQTTSFVMYNTLINAVRSVDANKVLIIEPIKGNTSLANADWSVIQNKSNLVMTDHTYYAGGDNNGGLASSGYAAGSPSVYVYNGTTGYTSTATAKSQMQKHIQMFKDWAGAQQIPLYMGEYGIGYDQTGAAAWIKDNAEIFNNLGNLPRTYWQGCGGTMLTMKPKISGTWSSWITSLTSVSGFPNGQLTPYQ